MAQAKKAPTTTTSIIGTVKASLGITLLVLTAVAFVLILILGQLFNGNPDQEQVTVFIALAVYAGLIGLAIKLLATGSAKYWFAAVFAGAGSSVLLGFGSATGGKAPAQFGHALLQHGLGSTYLSAGAVLATVIALIVAKWSDK